LLVRYSNLQKGRFLNSDGLLGETGDILSTNMYAYCAYNPIMNVDPKGTLFLSWLTDPIIQFCTSILTIVYVVSEVVSGRVEFSQAIEDFENADPKNSDPSKIADAHLFSFFNGSMVIIQDFANSSFSFNGTLFIHSGQKGEGNTILHEWGHTVQENFVGTTDFLLFYGIPSMICSTTKMGEEYFSMPWERTADIFGRASRDEYISDSESWAWAYLGLFTLI
jgi:hypothetical protein